MLITLLLLSMASLASAADPIVILHGDLSPSQVEWQLSNKGVTSEQRDINNARRTQMNAQQAQDAYNREREYQNGRVDTERFINH